MNDSSATPPCPFSLPLPEAQWAEKHKIKALPQFWDMARFDWLLGLWLLTTIGLTIRDACGDFHYIRTQGLEAAIPYIWVLLGWAILLLLFILAALSLPALYRLCVRRQSGIILSAIMAVFAFIPMAASGVGGALGLLLDVVVVGIAYKLLRCESCAALLPPGMRR